MALEGVNWESVIAVALVTGFFQAIGIWIAVTMVLNRINKKTDAIKHVLRDLHLSTDQEKELQAKLDAPEQKSNNGDSIGKTMKEILLWWKD